MSVRTMKRNLKKCQKGFPLALQPEILESRCMLSASFDPVSGSLMVVGDENGASDDVIRVAGAPGGFVEVTINGAVHSSNSVSAQFDAALTGAHSSSVLCISIDGGEGNDWLTVSGGFKAAGGHITVQGGAGNDTITGISRDERLEGNDGNDRLVGSKGADLLDGGAGDDLLLGGRGDDSLYGGDGQDRLSGGRGKNWLYANPVDHLKPTTTDVLVRDDSADQFGQVVFSDDLKQRFINAAVDRYSNLFDQSASPYYWGGDGDFWKIQPVVIGDWPGGGGMVFLGPPGVVEAFAAAANVNSSISQNFSQTNVQVAGVDEADIVKTDGHYIYTISDNQLTIVDASSPEQMHVVSQTAISGGAGNLYLQGNRLTVLSQNEAGPRFWGDLGGPITLHSMEYGPMPNLTVSIYDVSDASNPLLLEQTSMDGTLVGSREIGDRLVLVVSNEYTPPMPQTVASTTDPNQYVYESETAYRQRLEESSDYVIPHYTTTIPSPNGDTTISGSLVTGDHLYAPNNPQDTNIVSVVTFNVSDGSPGPSTSTSIIGLNGTLYVSPDSLYIAAQSTDTASGSWSWTTTTYLYKFALNEDSVPLVATGSVEGTTLNQYSMDEYNGLFRIATTSTDGGQSNNVFVLNTQNDQLQVVGSLTHVADSERIYAVRFMGDHAFMVTFQTFDPLFAIDLTDPTHPTEAGQLVVPGYSSYLYPIDSNHLIGVGQDVVNGEMDGLQLSLFDVTDLNHPTLIDRIVESPGTWFASEALTDPHAFSYFAAEKILAIPVNEGGWSQVTDNGLNVYQVDNDQGFILLGRVDQATAIRRSLQIDDYLYSIADHSIKVQSLQDPSNTIQEVTF